MQAHFIPGGTRFAQLCQDSCFLHDANMLGQQGMGHGPRTPTLRQDRAVFAERERADWTSDHVAEREDKREESREREREKYEGRERRKKGREKERETETEREKRQTERERSVAILAQVGVGSPRQLEPNGSIHITIWFNSAHIAKQTCDTAAPAGEQVIPQKRLRARTVEQRVDIPMPPIMYRAVVFVNYSMQVTMLLLCCRATHAVRRHLAKNSGLRLSPYRPVVNGRTQVTMKHRCCRWPDSSPQKFRDPRRDCRAMPIVMQRQVPRPSFNQEIKIAEIPQLHVDKVAAMPVVVQQQDPHPATNPATKHVEIPQTHYIDNVAAMSIVTQRQVPQVQTVPSPSINQVTKHAGFSAEAVHRQCCRGQPTMILHSIKIWKICNNCNFMRTYCFWNS